jgi:hypothetical protein
MIKALLLVLYTFYSTVKQVYMHLFWFMWTHKFMGPQIFQKPRYNFKIWRARMVTSSKFYPVNPQTGL